MRNIKLALILILGSVFCACALRQESSSNAINDYSRGCVIGVSISEYGGKLRRSVLAMIEEVEIKFRKGVCISQDESLPKETHGQAKVDADGTPRITVNPKTDDVERTLVHELFHLKLKAEGFPVFIWDGGKNLDPLRELNAYFVDSIEHRIFYPLIRKMGIDPTAHTKALIRAGEYQNSVPMTWYYTAKLLLDEPELIDEMSQWYEKNARSEMTTAARLAGIVTAMNPQTPEDKVRTVISLLNAIPDTGARFEESQWGERSLGTFRERTVRINISPR